MSLGTPPATSLRPTAVLELGRRTQKCKNPTEINPAGFLVLATSYSRTAYRRTTIGAAAFHCRVRNGNGWYHCATVTRVRCRTVRFAAYAARQSDADLWGPIVDLWRSESPRSIVRSLDFARDDKLFSKNKFCQFSDIYIQEVFSDSRFTYYDSRVRFRL